MKTIINLLFGLIFLVSEVMNAQSADQNYIRSVAAKEAVSTEASFDALQPSQKIESITYVDGLGRVVQSIALGISPEGKDLISFQQFDSFGRQQKSYLPFTHATGGLYQGSVESLQASFYETEQHVAHSQRPFTEHLFEASPLNRVYETAGPGANYTFASGHTQKEVSRFNTAMEVPIIKFSAGQLVFSQHYAANELHVSELADEDGKWTRTYTDKSGQAVMTTSLGNPTTTTYSVYDDRSMLRAVIPPLAYQQFIDAGNNLSSVDPELLFRYDYDERGRISVKKVPSRGEEFFVYDSRDQVVLSQTANQRINKEWTFFKYDALGRLVQSGIYDASSTYGSQNVPPTASPADIYALMQGESHQLFESPSGDASAEEGYTKAAFPKYNFEVIEVQHYDNYDVNQDGQADYVFIPQSYEPIFITGIDAQLASPLSNTSSSFIRGKATVSRTKVMDGTDQTWTYTATFYDDRGRIIQTQYNDHQAPMSLSVDHMYYDFSGKMLHSDSHHRIGTDDEVRMQSRMDYDHGDRLKREIVQVDHQPAEIVKELVYNELGELIEKNLGHAVGFDPLQSVDMRYDIRGRLLNINNCDLSNDRLIELEGDEEVDGKNLEEVILDRLVIRVEEKTDGSGDRIDIELEDEKDVRVSDEETGEEEIIERNDSEERELRREEAQTDWYSEVMNYLAMDEVGRETYKNSLSESQLAAFDEAVLIEQDRLTYNALLSLDGEELVIDFNAMSIPEGTSTLQAIELATALMETELLAKGVNNAGVLEMLRQQIVSYIVSHVGSVYFNDDGNDLWGECILYDQSSGAFDSEALFNGNISEMHWMAANDRVKRGYGFRYDDLSRLTKADYKAMDEQNLWMQEIGNFSVPAISYDLNGNITALERRGRLDITSPNQVFSGIDDLQYTYQGNRLQSVLDQSPDQGYAATDFRDHNTTPIDYLYDVNGNMIRDENKGMTLEYNRHDLISRVTFDTGDEIQYLYNGSGVKLRKKAIASDGTVNTTHYVGAFRYNDDGLSFISSSEGRLMPDDANDIFQFEYHLKDHLGSMRLAFSDLNDDHIIDNNTEILQVESYYPFGMKHEGIQTPQVGPRNLYNYTGKEDQTDFAFNMIDYGARMYDAPIGRWQGTDPLATSYPGWSPYNYVMGNPINLIDPDGRCAIDPEVTVSCDGLVVDVQENGSPINTFYDTDGTQLFLNDGAVDGQQLDQNNLPLDIFAQVNDYEVGDRLFYEMSASEMESAMTNSGSLMYRDDFSLLEETKFNFSYGMKSYQEYDFGHSYFKGKYDVSNDQMEDLYYGGGAAWGTVPFTRFEGTDILYNLPDAGNFMWGQRAMLNNMPLQKSLNAANRNESGGDTGPDQRAITAGWKYR